MRYFWAGSIALLSLVLLISSCDFPTGGPSFETETEMSTPLVMEKTFSFLGGPTSENEPLIDTTTSTFDSLFTIGQDPQHSILIEEEVSSFDVGSLDAALAEVTQQMGVDATLSSPVLQDANLATQEIDGGYQQENGVFESDPVSALSPVPQSGANDRVELPFPLDSLATPPFGGAEARLRSLVLTGETIRNGATVNQLTFTLHNDPSNPEPLTDGMGEAPVVEIQDADDDSLVAVRLPAPVAPGESKSIDLSVAGRSFGTNTDLVLTIDGSNPQSVNLETSTSPLRYQQTTLENVEEINVEGDTSDVSTVVGSDTQFAGIEVRSGSLQLEVSNDLSFPITVDVLDLENNPGSLNPLPPAFPALDVEQSIGGSIPAGQSETLSIDLGDRGIASSVDVRLRITSAQPGGTVTFSADGSLGASVSGSLTVESLYFWPEGEMVQTGGGFDLDTDRLQFEQPGDFVELSDGSLSLANLVNEPEMAFEEVVLSFPGVRKPPYARGDSLALRFTENPSGEYEYSPIGVDDPPRDIELDLSDLRLASSENRVEYHLDGRLETIETHSEDTLRRIQFDDEVRTDVSVGELDVRALEAGVTPFAVSVTDDADGDGRLDLSDDAEATVESFDGFGDLAGQLEGLQLEGSQLIFSVESDAGTDARLYTALQGEQGTSRSFLAGRGDRSVAPGDSLGDDFYRGGSRIAAQNLIQFDIPGAPVDEVGTHSVTLTDDNSNVDDFLSTLPTSLRFVGQALLTGDENGRIRLQRPLTFEAGLGVQVPLRFEDTFSVRDTVDADLTSLEEVTDPESGERVTISTSMLELRYENRVPMGAQVEIAVLDADENEVLRLPGNDEAFRVEPAPKTDDGTTANPQSGTVTVDLTEQELRSLAEGEQLSLRMTFDQQQEGPPVTVRATDTIRLSLRTEIDATVRTGD